VVRTDYASHELQYRLRRSSGHAGWHRPEVLAAQREQLSATFDVNVVPQQGRAIDLGCGAGDGSIFMARRGYQVMGVDLSPTAIEWASENADAAGVEVEFRVGSVLTLAGVEDASCDLALDWHCLHCIIGEDRRSFLRNARRVLRPGGVLISEAICGEAVAVPEVGEWDLRTRMLMVDGVAFRYLGRAAELEEEIRSAGFDVLHREVRTSMTGLSSDDLLTIAVKPS
jgi:SAM-dependent methyltransferase